MTARKIPSSRILNVRDVVASATPHTAEIARALLGPENKALSSRHELRFGAKGSVAVVIGGNKAGRWYDFAAAAGGDLLSLIQHKQTIGFGEALAYAADFAATPAPAICSHSMTAKLEANTQRARKLWQCGGTLNGTPAEAYLASRRLWPLPAGAEQALRFIPHGQFGIDRHPMLVALYRDIHTNEPCGVHRTALTPGGRKLGRKILGRKAGAAIKLSPNEDVALGLCIGEGVETTISAMLMGLCPAWALGDAGSVGAFPTLPGIEAITILVDNDTSGTGQMQSAKCRDRWLAHGREVVTVTPDVAGEDLNDVAVRL